MTAGSLQSRRAFPRASGPVRPSVPSKNVPNGCAPRFPEPNGKGAFLLPPGAGRTEGNNSFNSRPANVSPARAKALNSLARANAALANCRLCAHDCAVDRLRGELGACRAGVEAKVFSAQLEVGDELELIPTFAIALSGCDLRCDFCITGASSWNPRAGEPLEVEELAFRAEAALARGARTIMFLGGEPTIHLPSVLKLAAAMPANAKLVWKTNAHGSAQARELLEGVFDVWLADYKFGNDPCAARLARVPHYIKVVQENLTWAVKKTELIVRHLLMPGHLECCWRPIAQWVARELPGVKVSLRTGFWPGWHSARHAELQQNFSANDSERALQIGKELGLNLIQ